MLCLSKSQSLLLDVKESFGIMKGVAVKCCFTVKPLLLPPLAPPFFFTSVGKLPGLYTP
jgi:hypothetical protein